MIFGLRRFSSWLLELVGFGYTRVELVDWESRRQVLDAGEKL